MDNPAPPQVFAATPAGLPPLKEHFNRALELYKKRLKPMVLVLLAGGLLFAGIMLVMVGGGFALSKAMPQQAVPILIVASLVALFGGIWSFSWSAAACLAALANQEAGAKECLSLAKPRVLGLVWVHMLAGLLITGGYFLLGIPGILFTVWFFFAPFVYMSEGLGGLDALLKSREYVRGRWFATAWRLFAGWVFFVLISAIPLAGQLLGLILAPLPYILTFQVYQDLKALRGDVPFAPSGKAKAGILAAGVGGFLAIPMLIVFFFGGVLMLAFSQLKSKMPGMTAGISVNTTVPGVTMGASVKTSDSKGSIDASVLDRVTIPESPTAAPQKPSIPSAAPKMPAPAVVPVPAAAMPPAAKAVPDGAGDRAAAAAMPPVRVSLNTDAELVKEALDACRNEIGMFCYPARDNPAEALRCLKRYEDQALEKCRKKLSEARAER